MHNILQNNLQNSNQLISSQSSTIENNLKYHFIEGGEFIHFNKKDKSTNFKIPNYITKIRSNSFSLNNTLENIIISDSVKIIESGAFSHCTSLKQIILSNSITTIEPITFWACTSLQTITIPKNVTYIDPSAFEDCYKLTQIKIPTHLKSQIKKLKFPNKINIITY